MAHLQLSWQGRTYSTEAQPDEPLYKVLERLELPAGTEILAAKTNGSIHELPTLSVRTHTLRS